MLTVIAKAVKAFDVWGEPVAPLNMAGKSVYRTTFGGLVGIMVAGVISSFTYTRYNMLVERKDPKVSQVATGLDLMSPDAQSYSFIENNMTIVISANTN
jgi:hypothetical protein